MLSKLINNLRPTGSRLRRRRTIVDRNPLFDQDYYAAKYPHLLEADVDLHVHYSTYGCRLGYNPNALFDSAWYVTRYRDVAMSGVNPLDHYLNRGAAEGRDPTETFSSWLYLVLYPDVRIAGVNPLLHYLKIGKYENRVAPSINLLPPLATLRGLIDEDEPISDREVLVRHMRNWTEQKLDPMLR